MLRPPLMLPLKAEDVDPYLDYARKLRRDYPILSIFVAFFVVLSAIPLACFIGASLFISTFLLTVALLFATLTSAILIFLSGLPLLLLTLCFAAFLSLTLTCLTVGFYVLGRLVFLVRTEPTLYEGILVWAQELYTHVLSRIPTGVSQWTQSGVSKDFKRQLSPTLNNNKDDQVPETELKIKTIPTTEEGEEKEGEKGHNEFGSHD